MSNNAQWRVYKPNKSNTGAASRVEIKEVEKEKPGKDGKVFKIRNVQIFWVATTQIGTDEDGNAKFAWEDKTKSVTIKLGEVDLGEILAVLHGRKGGLGMPDPNKEGAYKGLYHQNDKGNASLQISESENGYNVRASKQVKGQPLVAVKHTLSLGEAEILRVLVIEAVRAMYKW